MAMITKAEFEARFAPGELEEIRRPKRMYNPTDLWVCLYDASPFVDLDHPAVRLAVMCYELEGSLLPGRSAEILGL